MKTYSKVLSFVSLLMFEGKFTLTPEEATKRKLPLNYDYSESYAQQLIWYNQSVISVDQNIQLPLN